MKIILESLYPHIHIVSGDAHDFYLHDPSNVARFVGTISLQPKVCNFECLSVPTKNFHFNLLLLLYTKN